MRLWQLFGPGNALSAIAILTLVVTFIPLQGSKNQGNACRARYSLDGS